MKIKKFIIEYQIKTTAAIKLISLKTTDPLIANKSHLSKEDIILILLTVERYFLQEEIFYFDYDLSQYKPLKNAIKFHLKNFLFNKKLRFLINLDANFCKITNLKEEVQALRQQILKVKSQNGLLQFQYLQSQIN